MQPGTGIDILADRQGIVDVFGPAFFFKRTEDRLLISRRHQVTLDDRAIQTQLTPRSIPERLEEGIN